MSLSQAVKTSINGDEYYTQENAVNMIVPYILWGGTRQSGARLIKRIVNS